MEINLEKGDRLIMSAPMPGETLFALQVLEVVQTVEESGVGSAIAVLIRRNHQPVAERPRVLITFEPRRKDEPPASA